MISKDSDYYKQRASEERANAAEADDPKIAAIHIELAMKFDALARAYAANPTPDSDTGNGE